MGKPIEKFSEAICKKLPDDPHRHTKTKSNAKWIMRNVRLKKEEQDEINAMFAKKK
jgi:hypothetical protein